MKSGAYNESPWTITGRLLAAGQTPAHFLILDPAKPAVCDSIFEDEQKEIHRGAFKATIVQFPEDTYRDDHFLSARATMIPLRSDLKMTLAQRQAKARKPDPRPVFQPTLLLDRDISTTESILKTMMEQLEWRKSPQFDGKYRLLLVDSNIYSRIFKVD
jgi:hypothetical protein